MELRTHTNLWQVKKVLYRIYDVPLPVPVTAAQIGILFVVAVPWWILMSTIGVKFAPPFGHIIWLFPPALAAWQANKPMLEGKGLIPLLISQLTYLGEPRRMSRLRPYKEPETYSVRAEVWHAGHLDERVVVEDLQSLVMIPRKHKPPAD